MTEEKKTKKKKEKKKTNRGIIVLFLFMLMLIFASAWWSESELDELTKQIILIFVFVAFFALVFYAWYRKIVNSLEIKVSRLIEAKDYEEIIRLAQEVPYDQMHLVVKINLAASYYHMNQLENAKAVFSKINKDEIPSEIYRKVIEDWEDKIFNKDKEKDE